MTNARTYLFDHTLPLIVPLIFDHTLPLIVPLIVRYTIQRNAAHAIV